MTTARDLAVIADVIREWRDWHNLNLDELQIRALSVEIRRRLAANWDAIDG